MRALLNHRWLRTGAACIAGIAIGMVLQSVISVAVVAETGSMMPTFDGGEKLLVDESWFDPADIEPGDIVIFDPPAAAQTSDGISGAKRVIAEAGQTISFARGHVFLDGVQLVETYIGDVSTRAPNEVIPGCVQRVVNQCTVPEGHFFVMGDNRAPLASLDSRFFGPIDDRSVEGRAIALFWPPSEVRSL